MADAKITGLSANTTPLSTDVTVMVDDPGGTPATQKITLGNLLSNTNLWAAYSPSWTGSGSNPAIVNGTLTGRYVKVGMGVWFYIEMVAGSSTTFGTGNYSFSLPTTSAEGATNFPPIGTWSAYDGSNNYIGFAAFASTTTVQLLTISIATASLAAGIVTNTAPATWNSGDKIRIKGFYESSN